MQWVRWAVGVFLVLLSMATWVPRIRIAGVAPDLLLGVVFLFALGRGVHWGMWVGVILGLLVGMEQPELLGRDSLALALAGLLVGRGVVGLDRGNPVVLLFFLFTAAFLADSVRAFWLAAGDLGVVPYVILRWALPGALYTVLVLPLLAWVVSRLVGRRDWTFGAS